MFMTIEAAIAAMPALRAALADRLAPIGIDVESLAGATEVPPTASSRTHVLHRGSSAIGCLRFTAGGDPLTASARLDVAVKMADDLWRARAGEQTVVQLATRIEQAYDQAHVLFRLARIPESPSACQSALQDLVDRLLGITNLGWIVLRFGDRAVNALRGQRFLAGKPPIAEAQFDALLEQESAREIPHPIFPIDRSPLASATGAEVLLQPLTFEGQRLGLLAAGNNGGDDPGLSTFETQLFAACAGYLDTFHANLARLALQEQMFLGTLRALTSSIDAKDPYTRGHSERVALVAHDMAIACGLDEAVAERYRIAGLVHDLGKIGVPEAVLCKPGRLTDDEFAYIRKHPDIGADILRDIPGLDDIRPGVLHHHERFDGTGYPHGLAGEAIPHVGRVLALADTFDAMSSNRSYRAKLPRDHVLGELIKCGGTQFDPKLAELFVKMDFTRFDEALRSHAELFPSAPIQMPQAA